jgi:hypothetical protein
MLSAALALLLLQGAPASLPPGPPPTATATAPAARPPAVVLPRDISSYFVGAWEGEGRFIRSGRPLHSTFTFEPIAGGEAILVRHDEKPPNAFAYGGLITMDTVAKTPVLLLASNNGGGGRIFRSAGWTDGRLVFTSGEPLRAAFALERITFVRESASAFRATYEMSFDGGQTWRVGDEQQFTRR